MKTTSAYKTYIDYWQDYGTGRKSHFGIRVWADRCAAITNVEQKVQTCWAFRVRYRLIFPAQQVTTA